MVTADTAAAPVEQGPGLEEAAKAFTGLLDREDGTPAPADDAAPDDSTPDTEVVADADAPPEETLPDEGDAEGEEAADTPEEGSDEPAQATARYTVKVNGKEESVTLEEALKGYSRTRDYTQKTDALATDRHVLESERAEVLKERETYRTLLGALQSQLQASTEQEPDWDALYVSDPLQWAKSRDDWRTKQDKLAAANYELGRLNSIKAQEQEAFKQKAILDGRQKMVEEVPEWKDAKRWDADRVRIIEYAQTRGYSAEEISNAYDPRAILVMNDARRWREQQATRKPVQTAQRTGPRAAPAGSARVSTNQVQRAQQRLAQTGSIDDAAKVFMSIL